MKTHSTAIASVLCTLFAGFAVTEAGTETIEVTEGGITFTVDRYDDGRRKPYRVSWSDPENGFSSAFKFNTDGVVTRIKADGDKYKVFYKTNGDLKRVTRTTSRRDLAEEDAAEAIEDKSLAHAGGRRRLYDCDDCEHTWDTLVNYGVPSVCNLVDYGDPFLEPAATAINLLCHYFDTLSAEEACEGQCDGDCLAPLTIALEWFYDTDLDLYVVEPVAGERVFYGNRDGRFGYLDQDNTSGPEFGPEQYIVVGGFPTSASSSTTAELHPLGEYWVVVSSYNNEYVRYKLTATTGSGDVILDVEDEFDPDCEGEELSHFFRVSFNEYVDNGCDIPDLDAIAVEGDQTTKGNRRG